MSSLKEKKSVHWAVKVFVLTHMVFVTGWALPRLNGDRIAQMDQGTAAPGLSLLIDQGLRLNSHVFQSREFPFSYYVTSTGLWQGWDMFAPNPASTDVYISAKVYMQDGSTFEHNFHRIKTSNIPEKFIFERYRKYRERLSGDEMKWKWPTTAKWFGLQAWEETGIEPVRVELWRHWMDIAPPGQPQPKEYNSYKYFETILNLDDLKAMKENP